jgi:ribonuclease HI
VSAGGRRRRPRRPGGTLKDGERRQLALAPRRAAAPPEAPAPQPVARVLCDGGSRGNPGPAAIAAVLLAPSGAQLAQRAAPVGRERRRSGVPRHPARARAGGRPRRRPGRGVLRLAARRRGAARKRARRAGLAALAAEAAAAAAGFGEVRWTWLPRARNQVADDLVRALLWPAPERGQAPRDSATRRIQ